MLPVAIFVGVAVGIISMTLPAEAVVVPMTLLRLIVGLTCLVRPWVLKVIQTSLGFSAKKEAADMLPT
jgi:hypothetical protein